MSSIDNTMQPDAVQATGNGSIDDIDADASPDDEVMGPFANVGRVVAYGALIWGGAILGAAAIWYCVHSRQPTTDTQPHDEPTSVYHAR